MTGHATIEESVELTERLQAYSPGTSSSAEGLELALLLVEPHHREEEALEILRSLIDVAPDFEEARIWYAYLLVHYQLDEEAFEGARSVLRPLLGSRPESEAAALHLLSYIESELDGVDPVPGLRRALSLCPDWVLPRWVLAKELAAKGETKAALDHLQRARASLTTEDPRWSQHRREFERSITGRTATYLREEIGREIQALEFPRSSKIR